MMPYRIPAPCGVAAGRVKRAFKLISYLCGAMQRSTFILTHLALVLATGAIGAGAAAATQDAAPLQRDDKKPMISVPPAQVQRLGDGDAQIRPVFRDYFRLPNAEQARIEQRVTIRISPRPAPMPLAVMSSSSETREGGQVRTIERKMGKCVPLNSILGVQSGGANKLMLFLRGQRLVSATLEKACQGRDYYSGFLVSQHTDGQLCTDRDELLARSGANCKVQGFREIVLVED